MAAKGVDRVLLKLAKPVKVASMGQPSPKDRSEGKQVEGGAKMRENRGGAEKRGKASYFGCIRRGSLDHTRHKREENAAFREGTMAQHRKYKDISQKASHQHRRRHRKT